MNIRQYLDLEGLTTYDTNIKAYIDDLKDVEAYNDLLLFPKVGKFGVIYIATSTKVLYAWSESGYYRLGIDNETSNKIETAYEKALVAYQHATTADGSNPHKTTYENIINTPRVATSEEIDMIINNNL